MPCLIWRLVFIFSITGFKGEGKQFNETHETAALRAERDPASLANIAAVEPNALMHLHTALSAELHEHSGIECGKVFTPLCLRYEVVA